MSDKDQAQQTDAEFGDNAKTAAVGKGNQQTANEQNVVVNYQPPPPGRYAHDHPARQYSLADVVVALIGDPMTEKPGLIAQVKAIDRRLSTVEQDLIDLKDLIIVRNESRGRVHLTPLQLFIFILVLILVIAFVAPWLRGVVGGGAVDGRIGLAILALLHG